MHSANVYSIRPATDDDAYALRMIAGLDSQAPVSRPALIGEVNGRPAAAMSLVDGRVVADPFVHTAELTGMLTMRFLGMRAFARLLAERKPRVPVRLAA